MEGDSDSNDRDQGPPEYQRLRASQHHGLIPASPRCPGPTAHLPSAVEETETQLS